LHGPLEIAYKSTYLRISNGNCGLKLRRRKLLLKYAFGSQLTDANIASETITVKSDAARPGKGGGAKQHIISFARSLVPIAALAATASLSHAAPTIDMSGVTSVMQTVETACLLIGAIIVLISVVFSVFSFAGGNVMRGITGVAGVLFGGLVIGLGPTWITSLTGQGV
jgi:hypothetical protein